MARPRNQIQPPDPEVWTPDDPGERLPADVGGNIPIGNSPTGGSGGGGGTGGGGGGGNTPTPEPTRPITQPAKPTRGRPVKPGVPPPPIPDNPDPEEPTPPIQPNPNQGEPPSAQERTLTYDATGGIESIIYGEVHNVGGSIAEWWPTNSGGFGIRFVIAKGPIDSIFNVRIDDKPMADWNIPLHPQGVPPQNQSGYQIYTGTPDQPVSGLMQTKPGWVPSKYPGVAYIVAVFPMIDHFNLMEGGTPDITRLLCDVKGLKVHHPVTDPTLTNRYYSEDLTLIIADVLNSKRYGGRIPKESINWDIIVDDTYPFTNETMPDESNRKRYPIGIMYRQQQTLDSVVENLRAHGQLFVPFNNGQYNIVADRQRPYSGIHFTDDHLIEGSYFRVKGASEVYGRINVDITDSENDWVDKTIEVERPSLPNTYTPIETADYALKGTKYTSQGKRIATYLLNRSLMDLEFFFSVNQYGTIALPGERIRITSTEMNIEDQDLIVVDVTANNNGTWQYQCEIYDDAVFSFNIIEDIITVNPAIPSPFDKPDPPSGLSITEEEFEGSGGLPVRKIKITYIPYVTNYVSSYTRIEYKIGAGDWVLLDESNLGVAYIDDVIPETTYNVRLFTITAEPWNVRSDAVTGSIVTEIPVEAVSSKSLRIYSNLQTITHDSDGDLYPGQDIVFNVVKINSTATVTWDMTRANGDPLDASLYLSTTTGDSTVLTAVNFDAARGTSVGVTIIAHLFDIEDFFDSISVVSVQDGLQGSPGPAGPSAVPLKIIKDRDVITYNSNGDLEPAEQTVRFEIQKQNTNENATWEIKRVDGTPLDVNFFLEPVDDSAEIAFHNNRFGTEIDDEIIAFGYAGVIEWEAHVLPESRQLTADKFETARGTTRGVFVTASLTDAGLTVTDTTSVLSVQDGAQGADATAGAFALPDTATSIGGRVLIGPTTKLTQLLGSNDTTMYVQHDTLINGDVVYLQTAPSGIKQVEFIRVTSGPSGVGPYSYTIVRNLDGSGNNQWAAGDVIFNTGQAGFGFIDLYADRGLKSASEYGPTMVGNVRQSTTFDDWKTRFAIGNLNGLYGYNSPIYGAAFGVPDGPWVKIDPVNGVRIGHNATTKLQIDAAGNATFAGSVTLQNQIPAANVSGLADVATSGTLPYGSITGTKPPSNADVTLSAINGGLSITGGGLVLASGGAAIRGGQTAYNTGTGFWLGDVGGVTKFSIGNSQSGKGLRWDGSNLYVDGNGTFSGTIYASAGSFSGEVLATTGTIGGWDITNDGLSANNVILHSDGYLRLGISQIEPGTQAGYMLFNGGLEVNSDILMDRIGVGSWRLSIGGNGVAFQGETVITFRGVNAIADADGTLTSATSKINAILAALRTRSIIRS